MKQKVLFVPGVFNPKWYQKYWKAEIENQDLEFIEFENQYYSYWKIDEMKRAVDDGVKLFKKYENEELIIVCHSFGGILINCILQKLKNYKIKKIIILASPLGMNILGMKRRKKELNYNENLIYNAEVISYGGYIDPIVPYVWTKYNTEEHHNVFGEHFYFIFSKRFIRKIIQKYIQN